MLVGKKKGMKMENRELKPCPFCGGKAEIIVLEKSDASLIKCTTAYCGFMRYSFNNGETDEEVALRLTHAWNRRVNNGT